VNKNLVLQLIDFVKSKPNKLQRFLYSLKALYYYFPLALENKRQKTNESDELLGDDIYPLF
tara:strand:+ start:298 stop:480 length:183 start_codon:yes stop_codon:yes gene_type:complete